MQFALLTVILLLQEYCRMQHDQKHDQNHVKSALTPWVGIILLYIYSKY